MAATLMFGAGGAAGDGSGQTLLDAVWKGDVERVRHELDSGANVNETDVSTKTTLSKFHLIYPQSLDPYLRTFFI